MPTRPGSTRAVLATLSSMCYGDRSEMIGLLFEVVIAFSLETPNPEGALVVMIDTLQKALQAGRDAVAKARPS
jgi:hypothetical protein